MHAKIISAHFHADHRLLWAEEALEGKMKRLLCLTAAASSVATVLALGALGWAGLPTTVKLENARVRVREVISPPGGVRERGVRGSDQVIVFLDDCRYERTDPQTGQKTIRERKSGDVIWHSKGEDAPQLVNAGTKPYRTLVIELK